LAAQCIIGLDLAGLDKNPSGIAAIKNADVQAKLVFLDGEILDFLEKNNPIIVAIDAPLSEPKKGYSRNTEREMLKQGYKVFPPFFMHMRQLTLRAIELNKKIQKTYKTIEVHPTSSRKALQILPPKEWPTIQQTFIEIGLKGELQTRSFASHELDAITAALTAKLYLEKQTEQIGDEQEGYRIVPKREHWSQIKI